MSRDALARLCNHLQLGPLQAELLYRQAGLALRDDELAATNGDISRSWILDQALAHFSPVPAYVLDNNLNIKFSNKVVANLQRRYGIVPAQYQSETNLLLTMARPDGLRPFIANWPEVVKALLWRLRYRRNDQNEGDVREIERALTAIEDVRPLLREPLAEASLAGGLDLQVVVGKHGLQAPFSHVSMILRGPLRNGQMEKYRIESFIPASPAAAQYLQALSGK